MASARDRLASARATLASGFPSAAVGGAYYAMLYAARAALSEEDRYAKTHRGTWSLFGELFVATGRLDAELARAAGETQELREGAGYDALDVSREQAEAAIAQADGFVAAIAAMLGA